MEPLYRTITKYTMNEHIKLMTTVNRDSSMYNGFSAFFMAIMMATGVYIYIKSGELAVAIVCAVIGISFPLLLELRLKHQAKEVFEKNKETQNLVMELDFYQDHYEQTSQLGNTSVRYSQLYKILENKTNYYLMISPYLGSIVLKDNCSPDLIEFLNAQKGRLEGNKKHRRR